MGRARSKQIASVLLTAWLSLACGRTERPCRTCPDSGGEAGFPDSGGSSSSGGSSTVAGAGGSTSGGTFGMAGVSQGGASNEPFWRCAPGGPAAPLIRYSAIDLNRTLDAIIGDGASLVPDGLDRSDLGFARSTTPGFVQNLTDVVRSRTQAAVIDEGALTICPDAQMDRRGCVDEWIRERGLRIYRRPLSAEQVSGYVNQFVQTAGSATALDGARRVLFSMLLSPYFVLRVELGDSAIRTRESPPSPNGEAPAPSPLPQPPRSRGTPLGAFEVAARLSHFLTRQAPDLALLNGAASGEILQSSDLMAHAERLLQTPEVRTARTLQHVELLHLEAIATPPDLDPSLLALRVQTETFIDDVLTNRNGSLRELLSSPRQPLNRSLASRYGIDLDLNEAMELVDLNPTYYAGVLAQGAWLWRSPRPTLRGVHIYDDLLCTPVPPPPLDLPPVDLVGATPRERISNATSTSPTCMACHGLMDPAGFALEAFDETGALTGFDTHGELRLQDSPDPQPLAGPPQLGQAIAASTSGKACMGRRYLEHLLERRLEMADDELLLGCLAPPEGADLDLNALARVVAVSDAMTRMAGPALTALGVSSAVDPLDHAIEETESLLNGFLDGADRSKLAEYAASLRTFQAQLPQP